MITNRTASDVERAKQIRAEKVQKGIMLTESDIAVLERGILTVNTLNRIEQKQDELRRLFNSAGYWNTNIVTKSWTYTDIFYTSDYKRILENNNILKEAFFVFADTPKMPNVVSSAYKFQEINDLEKLLVDLETMLADMKSRYRKSGTFKSGEANLN